MKIQESNTPFSLDEVSKMLKMDQHALNQYCQELPITPKKDLRTGTAMFSSQDVNMLKKARELHAKGESLVSISKKLTKPNALTTRIANKSDVTVILDTLTKAKDDITSNLTKVIEEKLDGMDEVVVELIKCKSENENIKQKMKILMQENELLKYEINKFRPFVLGLYRREEE